MSSEEFTSIEENGNYWLSKTNTAYHIINPNASNLTTIEANGYYSLARGGDTYYILDASGNSIKLNLNGRTFFNDFTGVVSQTGSTNTYTPTNVEENPFDGGFLVLASRNDVTPNWDNSSWFNYNNFGFEFNTLGKYTGSDIKIVNNYAMPRPGIEYESLFELDLDNNGVITPRESPTNLLDISGNQHHLDDGHGGDSIILKRDNVIIDPNSNGGLNATQVQKNGDHYELLLVHENVKYDVWKFDASGNFVSSIKAKLWEDELKFGIDINGDGDTGLVEIEDNGDVHLKHGDNTYNGAAQYYIINENDDPIGLTYAGWAIRSDSSNGWNVTQVEESGDGYQIFWSGPDGKYSVWNVDALGSIQSQVTAPLWQHEITFEHDLNGDLSKGLVTIEDNGNINLAHGDNQYIGDAKYYIVKGNDNPISLTQGGVAKSYASSNAWKFTQVEESGDGYQILLSGPDGKYSVWNVDALGSIQSQVTAKLWQHEITFEYDLNGDNYIGLNLNIIDNNGDYKLATGAGKYHIINGNGDRNVLTKDGWAIRSDSSNGWNVTQVEESGDGYQIFWSGPDGKYSVWNVDALGSIQSQVTAPLWQHEITFEHDLNGDLSKGLVTIEDNGNINLAHGDNQYIGDAKYYIVKGNDNPISLTQGGVAKSYASSNAWKFTQVEESGDGYQILLSGPDGKYSVWNVDALGSIQSQVTAKLWQHEITFEYDLNGDNYIGLNLNIIDNNGDYKLATGAGKYHIINGNGDRNVLTKDGWAIRSDSSNGWNVTQVEESGDGYQIFWSGPDGKYSVWNVDALGSIQSQVTAPLWQHEITFEHDLNGDLSKGLVTIEDNGNINLAHGDNQYIGDAKYYIVKGNDNPISLTQGGVAKSYASSNAWKFTQVEESGDGYQILLSGPDGKYSVWNVDALGSIQSQVTAKLWQHEITFEYDLNGDGLDSGDNNIWDRHGIDYFDGGAGDDIINGFSGHDTLIGGEGNDRLTGDGGSGFAGNDILFGNAGNDWLRGRAGDDELYGGDGDDILIGDLGSDTITTGSGSDRIILRARDLTDPSGELSEADTITDFTDVSDLLSVTQGDVDIHYSQLTIAQGSGSNSNDTIIKYGSEYLAILKNIDVYLLSEDDFTPAGIALDIA